MFWTLRTLNSLLSSQFCARPKPQVILVITQSKKNCAIIAPSRVRAWFENKRFDWLSVNFFVHWPIRMLALLPFLHSISLYSCPVLRKNCTVVSQSESSYFCMYIIKILIMKTSTLFTFFSSWCFLINNFTTIARNLAIWLANLPW